MAPLKASVLKAFGRQDDSRVELTARAASKLNAGAALRAAMAVTAFGPTGDAPGDVDVEVILTLASHRPMIFEDIELEILDRVGVLRRRPMTLLIMISCRKVPRCCVISCLARTLMFSVGHVWGIHLHAWGRRRCSFSEVQGWCKRSPHQNVVAYREMQ